MARRWTSKGLNPVAVVLGHVVQPLVVEQDEDLVVLPPELAQPLEGQRLRGHDQGALGAAGVEEAVEDQAGLDRLAQAHLVGQQPAHGIAVAGALGDVELVGEELDAPAEERAQARRPGGCAAGAGRPGGWRSPRSRRPGPAPAARRARPRPAAARGRRARPRGRRRARTGPPRRTRRRRSRPRAPAAPARRAASASGTRASVPAAKLSVCPASGNSTRSAPPLDGEDPPAPSERLVRWMTRSPG